MATTTSEASLGKCTVNSLKVGAERLTSTPLILDKTCLAYSALSRFNCAIAFKPFLPIMDIKIAACKAHRETLVQILEVAFSRRICCSRACKVLTKQRWPLESTVSPTMRPGILRIYFLRAHMNPK